MRENIISRYWKAYGGFRALITSPYLWVSVFISLALYPHWSQPNWWDDVLSIMPNLLGFSLGGYAMWIAIGDDDFRQLISGEDEDGEASPYMEMNAAFVHFIFLQLISIILALFAKAYYFELHEENWILEILGSWFTYICLAGYYFAYLVFIYAILSALAATLSLLRVSSWYDIHQTNKKGGRDNL